MASHDYDDTIVLGCSFGFADQWLLSRFTSLQDTVPDKKISVLTSDRMDMLDMSQIDIAIVTEIPDVNDRSISPLFPEIVFPICSPDYLASHPGLMDHPERLLEVDLIEYDSGTTSYLDWQGWFEKNDLYLDKTRITRKYNSYPFVCRAVEEGKGVALGWQFLVDKYLSEGSFVKIGPQIRNRESVYYLQCKQGSRNSQSIKIMSDWFREEATKTTALK